MEAKRRGAWAATASWAINGSPWVTEELAWRVDPDALEGVPKSRRRKITGTYRAAVPFELRDKGILIPAELQSRMEEVAFLLVRFDAQQEARGYDLPALLLRSESAASFAD